MALFRRYLYNGKGVIKSTDKEFNKTLDKFRDDIASGRLRYIFNRCVCGSLNEKTISERDRLGLFYRYVLCMDCGLVRANPIMDSESTAYFYEKYYQRLYHDLPGSITSPAQEFKDTAKFSLKYYVPFLSLRQKQRIIMIGCGTGAVLYPFMAAGHECVGVDFCAEKINYGRSKGLELYAGHYEMLLGLNRKADIVLMFDVLEHLLDLREDLEIISKLLSDEGVVAIGVPDISRAYLYHGGNLIMDTLYCHNYWFSRGSLNNTMKACGFSFTGKYKYIGIPHGLVAFYRYTGNPERIYDPLLARKTLRKLLFTEYLYRLRKITMYDFLRENLVSLIKKSPFLKSLAYRILGKDEN